MAEPARRRGQGPRAARRRRVGRSDLGAGRDGGQGGHEAVSGVAEGDIGLGEEGD